MSRSAWIAWCLTAALLLAGCGDRDDVPGVDAGRFTARIDGAMEQTMDGRAVARTDDGRLVGVELSADSVRGLSVDVEPQRQPRGVYEVVDWSLLGVDRGTAPPGTAAFLELPNAQFHAVAGTLTVSYARSGEIGGSFVFRMEGTYDGVANDEPFLSVTGSFRAAKP